MLTLGVWLHNLNPFALHIHGSFGIRWYGLAYVAGFAVAWLLLVKLARRGLILLKPHEVADVLLGVILGVLVGGRLGYVLVYDPSLLGFRSSFPFWGVLELWKGGMASHGGMVGVIVACLWNARKLGLPALHLMDLFCLVSPIGIFFGRIANFVNAELLGRIAVQPEDAAAGAPLPWWGVRFAQELVERPGEARLTFEQQQGLGNLLVRVAKTGGIQMDAPDWDIAAAGRAIAMIQNGDTALARELAPFLSVRHPSQLYQAAAEGIVLFGMLWLIWAKPRRPGIILAWFFIIYGAGRIATEFIRLPDAQFGDAGHIWGLSRGQWLSVLMVAAGMGVLAWVMTKGRRGVMVGGWASAGKSAAA